MTGNARSGVTVTTSSSVNVLIRVMHISRGRPLTSALHEPHLPALQFQRTARSGVWVACSRWMTSRTTSPSLTSTREVLEVAVGGVAAPDPEVRVVAHQAFVSSGRIASSPSVMYFAQLVAVEQRRAARAASPAAAAGSTSTPSPSVRQTRLTLRHSGLISGKSSRV